ncbi:hypothetical protein C1H46_031597 [Malus baccata]|uniref:Uncharacterized protein n=1 Tax=Malus baccata TaxID=106549 RepID=A0A540L8R7_MALBA|nr:hypothetical protein C1H46_031597 [Malus baccata]
MSVTVRGVAEDKNVPHLAEVPYDGQYKCNACLGLDTYLVIILATDKGILAKDPAVWTTLQCRRLSLGRRIPNIKIYCGEEDVRLTLPRVSCSLSGCIQVQQVMSLFKESLYHIRLRKKEAESLTNQVRIELDSIKATLADRDEVVRGKDIKVCEEEAHDEIHGLKEKLSLYEDVFDLSFKSQGTLPSDSTTSVGAAFL